MNERIQQLAVAAAPANSSIPQSEWNIPKEFIEKFAELIVRECAGRVDWILAEGGGTQGDLIREHFGVEP
jgi:hypothetical protein